MGEPPCRAVELKSRSLVHGLLLQGWIFTFKQLSAQEGCQEELCVQVMAVGLVHNVGDCFPFSRLLCG